MILQSVLIAALATECAPNVERSTIQALIQQESSNNVYAIGVVGAPLTEQPNSLESAIEIAESLIASGANISLGLGQINYKNLPALKMTIKDTFDACLNIQAIDEILSACYKRAQNEGLEEQDALKGALSCYYSNNFRTGQLKEKNYGNTSYVERIAKENEKLVPRIMFNTGDLEQINEQNIKKRSVKAIEEVERKSDNWDVFNDF